MRIHSHDPVGRIDPVVAAPRAHVRVTRENRAMQHQHVATEHKHFAIHRRGIWDPRCPGAFAAHRIGNVHRGLHRHLHMRHVVRFVPLHGVHLMRFMRHHFIAVMLMHIV